MTLSNPIFVIDRHQNNLQKLEYAFEYCDCPFDAWDTKTGQFVLKEEYTDWLIRLADWRTFITLTFRDQISADAGLRKVNLLIRRLNQELFGDRYTRIVGHSYFSYILCAEYQERDVLHYHWIVDRPVDFLLIHSLWNTWAGFAQTKQIRSQIAAISYSIKYAIKENDIKIYQAKQLYKPNQYPIWWKDLPEETI